MALWETTSFLTMVLYHDLVYFYGHDDEIDPLIWSFPKYNDLIYNGYLHVYFICDNTLYIFMRYLDYIKNSVKFYN